MAGIMDIFVAWFANPVSIAMMGVFILVGVLIGVMLRPWMGNQVIKIVPEEHRFVDLDVDEETAISIQCKPVKGMPLQRFFKHHPGFTGIVGRLIKKPITRWLGLAGTAYTWQIEEGKWKKLGGLADAIRTVWGEEFWNTVPQRQQEMLKESRIQVTVGLDQAPITPEGMRAISEEDIKQEEDRRASKTFWEEHQGQMKGLMINSILAGGMGFGIAMALMALGILHWGTTTTYTPPPNNGSSTTGFILWLHWFIMRII